MTRDGFTLVELMIVVAIIGVLASIAVPQYSKFQAKSRQSEVRIQLGAAYTVEQSFAAENSTYTACLGDVGYNRDGTKFYYTIGFEPGAAAASAACGPGAAAGTCLSYQWQYQTTPPPAKYVVAGTPCVAGSKFTSFPANITEPGAISGVTTEAMLTPGTSATTTIVDSTQFVIGATGDILAKAPKPDGWTIDNNKQILNVQSGLAN